MKRRYICKKCGNNFTIKPIICYHFPKKCKECDTICFEQKQCILCNEITQIMREAVHNYCEDCKFNLAEHKLKVSNDFVN